MRVTNQMMASNALTNLGSLRSRMDKLQNQVATGHRIERSSEDPTAGGDVMRVQSRLQLVDQWGKNLGDARAWTRATEGALAHMTDLLGRARDLALMGANDTMNNQQRQSIVPEAKQILEDLLATLNSEHMESNLFGGFGTTGAPFALDMAVGGVTYAGDSGEMLRDVGPGVTVSANTQGNRFGNWAMPDNILTTVWQLTQDLQNGPSTAVANNLTNLDRGMQTLITLRTEAGARDRRLEQADMRLKDTMIHLEEIWQQAQGVDMEKAIIDLNSTETTYRAALQVGARVIPPTLADFLR